MRQPVRATVLMISTLCAAPSLGAEALESVFQVTYQYGGSEQVLNETTVPLVPDTCYSWYIRIDPATAPKVGTEVLTLPVALDDWGDVGTGEDGIEISEGGKVATHTFTPDIDNEGWFTNSWCVVEGDPLGAHSIAVSLDGEALTTFDFETVLPEDYRWPSISQPVPRERSVDRSW